MSEMLTKVSWAVGMAMIHADMKVNKVITDAVAHAAIEAMREPTEAMVAVMATYDWSRDRFVPPRLMRPFEDDAADCWGEMIDEALK